MYYSINSNPQTLSTGRSPTIIHNRNSGHEPSLHPLLPFYNIIKLRTSHPFSEKIFELIVYGVRPTFLLLSSN